MAALARTFADRIKPWLSPLEPHLAGPMPATVPIYPLEPRVLYDGSLAAVAAEAVSLLIPDPIPAAAPSDPGREVAVIDTSVKDHQRLEEVARNAGMEVILISSQDAGLDTLTRELSQSGPVDVLHILSHGESGQLVLGRDMLSLATLDHHRANLATLSGQLSEDADIRLYGCSIGSGRTGDEFLDRLALITQADIAASVDDTGPQRLGGDWDLEIQKGEIESDSPFTEKALLDFSHLLSYSGNITLNNANYAGADTSGATSNATFNVGSYLLIADGVDIRTESRTGYTIAGIYNRPYENQLNFRFSNTEAFDVVNIDLNHFSWAPGHQGDLTFVFSTPQGHSYTAATLNYYYRTTFNLNFTGITELQITVVEGTGFYMALYQMQFANVRPNSLPTLTGAPSDLNLVEDTPGSIDLSTVQVGDADNDPLTLSLTVNQGSFGQPADGAGIGAGVTETWVNSTLVTLSGAAADINTYLDTPGHLQIQGATDLFGNNAATVTLGLTDNILPFASNPVVNLDIAGVNDAPAISGIPLTLTLVEETLGNLNLSPLTIQDVDADPLTLRLTVDSGIFAAPADGSGIGAGVVETQINATTLLLQGSATDIDTYLNTASHIQYQGATNAQGSAAATITLLLNDGSLNSQPANVSLDITNTSDAPQGLDSTVSTYATQEHYFTPADFGFSDPDPGDSLNRVRLSQFYLHHGSLTLYGNPVLPGDWISAWDIYSLVYQADFKGTDYLSFLVEDSSAFNEVAASTAILTLFNSTGPPAAAVPDAEDAIFLTTTGAQWSLFPQYHYSRMAMEYPVQPALPDSLQGPFTATDYWAEPPPAPSMETVITVDQGGQIHTRMPADTGGLGLAGVEMDPDTRALRLNLQGLDPATVLKAVQPQGEPLPSWLTFSPASGEITGTPPLNADAIRLQIQSTGQQGEMETLELHIRFEALGEEAPPPPTDPR